MEEHSVTFLFTDIEGSTRLWEAHPDGMRAALTRHDALLAQAVRDHHGEVFKTMLAMATPTEEQGQDTDWLLTLGEIFTLIVYAQLVLENAEIYELDEDLVDEIFDVIVRDLSAFAVELHNKASTTPEQAEFCTQMIRRPALDLERYERVWQNHVYAQRDAYQMPE